MKDPTELMKRLLDRVNQFSKNSNPVLRKEHRILSGPIEVLTDTDGFKTTHRYFILDENDKEWVELDLSSLPNTSAPHAGDIVRVEGLYRGGFFNSDWDRLITLKYELIQRSLCPPSTSQ